MVKVNYKLWKRSFPFTCSSCKRMAHENAEICQYCGKEGTLKETTKKDYKIKFKRMKEL